jgi:hypothetical protein
MNEWVDLPVQSGARRDGIADIDGNAGNIESTTYRILWATRVPRAPSHLPVDPIWVLELRRNHGLLGVRARHRRSDLIRST